jgi:hypothetical protein
MDLSKQLRRSARSLDGSGRAWTWREFLRRADSELVGLVTVVSAFPGFGHTLVKTFESDAFGLSPLLLLALVPPATVHAHLRSKRSRTKVTKEALDCAEALAHLVRTLEALEPSSAKDELLEACREAGAVFIAVGTELAAAPPTAAREVVARHEDLRLALGQLAMAVDALKEAQRERAAAFAVRADLSASADATRALLARTRAAQEGAEVVRDIETSAHEEVKVASASARPKGVELA